MSHEGDTKERSMAKLSSEMAVSFIGVGLLSGLLTAWVATLVSAF